MLSYSHPETGWPDGWSACSSVVVLALFKGLATLTASEILVLHADAENGQRRAEISPHPQAQPAQEQKSGSTERQNFSIPIRFIESADEAERRRKKEQRSKDRENSDLDDHAFTARCFLTRARFAAFRAAQTLHSFSGIAFTSQSTICPIRTKPNHIRKLAIGN